MGTQIATPGRGVRPCDAEARAGPPRRHISAGRTPTRLRCSAASRCDRRFSHLASSHRGALQEGGCQHARRRLSQFGATGASPALGRSECLPETSRSGRRDARCHHSRKADKACSALADEVLEEVGELRAAAAREKGGEHVRYILAIAGCPGSGKSTLAKRLCSKINTKSQGASTQEDGIATVVPMDGFHYTRAELDQMLNPSLAHKRRGSHWTFDSELFVKSIKSITAPGSEGAFPSFDHGIGDPVPGAVLVAPHHEIVIVEGLYLFLDAPPWNELLPHYDKRVFIKCPIGLALHRVMHRKVKTLGQNPMQAKHQVDFNDKKNAITVWKTRKRADVLLPT